MDSCDKDRCDFGSKYIAQDGYDDNWIKQKLISGNRNLCLG